MMTDEIKSGYLQLFSNATLISHRAIDWSIFYGLLLLVMFDIKLSLQRKKRQYLSK
jgi:hypothetical protein